MCVIFVVPRDDQRPSKAEIHAAFEANSHGGGCAWREREEKGAYVCWEKGLDLDEMVEKAASLPTPYVLHFRIASCGGITPKLTHPFPILTEAPLHLKGRIKGGSVLFHNGHWGGWEGFLKDAVFRGNRRLPKGVWSDSRTMAWMAAHFGEGMLNLIDEKIVVFSAVGEEILGKFGNYTSDWQWHDRRFMVSNAMWARNVASIKFDANGNRVPDPPVVIGVDRRLPEMYQRDHHHRVDQSTETNSERLERLNRLNAARHINGAAGGTPQSATFPRAGEGVVGVVTNQADQQERIQAAEAGFGAGDRGQDHTRHQTTLGGGEVREGSNAGGVGSTSGRRGPESVVSADEVKLSDEAYRQWIQPIIAREKEQTKLTRVRNFHDDHDLSGEALLIQENMARGVMM